MEDYTVVTKREASSFRDPSGFLFYEGGNLMRIITPSYLDNYHLLMRSGLYQSLVDLKLLIPHKECPNNTIMPEVIPFISYPYEWCFGQLRDAALTVLRIEELSLEYGMTLKDASAYNIQFRDGKPILIDTLSFVKYQKNRPWVAYKQFCEHFLAPLLLMRYTDIRLNQLLRVYLDGIPLSLTSTLLPLRTYLKPLSLLHIHLHAKSQTYFRSKTPRSLQMSKSGTLGLIRNLKSIRTLHRKPVSGSYYNITNYSGVAFTQKRILTRKYIERVKPKTLWDLGANIGIFSRIASSMGIQVISLDIDPNTVEASYSYNTKDDKLTNILPLVMDITNPSPGLGWENTERKSLLERGPADMVMALALIHHLVVSNNTPLWMIADLLRKCGHYLLVEFVPKEDSQFQRLLLTREDIFSDYTEENFKAEFGKYFRVMVRNPIKDSLRTLYLMEAISE